MWRVQWYVYLRNCLSVDYGWARPKSLELSPFRRGPIFFGAWRLWIPEHRMRGEADRYHFHEPLFCQGKRIFGITDEHVRSEPVRSRGKPSGYQSVRRTLKRFEWVPRVV